MAARLGAHKEDVFATDCDGLQCPVDPTVVDLLAIHRRLSAPETIGGAENRYSQRVSLLRGLEK
jgi:hypothetical protein